ncbi:MAG: hypothetical protein QME52_00300 [Bacteroidota bacterium]|nr:hypothetical protein [Bacteroidota bacterium]
MYYKLNYLMTRVCFTLIMLISQLTILRCQDLYRYDWDTVQVVLTKGWNIVSLPLYFNYGKGIHKDSLFRNAVSSLFTYKGSYVPCDTLQPEIGYWIKLVKAETVQIIACPAGPIGKVPVRAGWNIIGSTNIKVLVDTITIEPAGIIISKFYYFDPDSGYMVADTIVPGKGYWVKAKSAGTIKLQDVPGGGPEPQWWPFYYDYPSWHPAGEWIASEHGDSVDADGDGRYDEYFSGVWLVHAETGEKKPLLRYASHPDWSPDGSHLVFYDGRDYQIYTVKILCLDPVRFDTNGILRLTNGGKNFFPKWSPDGEWILYQISYPMSVTGSWLVKPDGSTNIQLPTLNWYPIWSTWHPSATKILYFGVAGSMFFLDIKTNQSKFFTVIKYLDSYIYEYPKYSPEGNSIAFFSKPRVNPPALWMIDSTGSNLQKLSPDYVWKYDWSPDGTMLVFLYWVGLCPRSGSGHLWIMNIDGTGLRQLTR